MTNNIIDYEDFEIVSRARAIDKLNNKETDILDLYEGLGYTITPELIEEVIEIDNWELPEEKTISTTFYIREEKNLKIQLAKLLKDKMTKDYNKYELIAYARRKKEFLSQKTDNLKKKRVRLPQYMATLLHSTELINCTTVEEIKNFDFNLGDIFL